MIPADIMTMAHEVFKAHGLYPYWHFKLDGAKRRFGQCDSAYKVITMSRHLVMLNTPEECRLTLLHEVAHALAGCHEGHGPRWAMKCRELGIKPLRCYNGGSRNVVTPKPNFYEVCPGCRKAYPRYRRTRKASACGKCCNTFSAGKYDSRFALIYSVDGIYREVKTS